MLGYFPPHVMFRGYANPLHNSLAQNSAVPIFLVPPQMLSECLQSLIPHNGRTTHNRRTGRKETQPSTCESCGTAHHDHFQCPAANRMCYSCRRYGHYANFCKFSRKSDSQPDRKCENNNQEVDISALATTDAVQENISKVEDLEAQLGKSKAENVHLQEHCADLQDQIDSLSEKVKHFTAMSGEVEEQKSTLEGQFQQLFVHAVHLDNKVREFHHLTTHLLDEFDEVAGYHVDPEWEDLDKPCSSCGTRRHDGPCGSCLAEEWKCVLCNKTGHFAAMCDDNKYLEVNVTTETENMFKTYAGVYGIELETKIHCYCELGDSENESS